MSYDLKHYLENSVILPITLKHGLEEISVIFRIILTLMLMDLCRE